ncbi:MAG: winged helix-turn-helix domain-containing protein [Actinomycetota bacterium]
MSDVRTLTPTIARRLAIVKQRLAGPRPTPDREGNLDTVRDLGCLQLDPISVVARSHVLVLWSRLGAFDRSDLEALLWEERRLFEYWAHRASVVLTEDYPIHHLLMRRYPSDRWAHSRRTRLWLEQNPALKRHVLARLRKDGPLRLRDFEDRSVVGWQSGGWTSGRNVDRMLDVLWTQGRVMVAGRRGNDKLWDLAERWLPAWTPRERLSEQEIVRRAAQRSLRALGVATARHIESHFTIGRYPGLAGAIEGLEKRGVVERVRIVDDGREWTGTWYVHGEDVPLLEHLGEGGWEPRTTLLSPFDNLIIDRARTERLFGFHFRMEIYVPKTKRQFGYYALPILHGDRLVGRVDPSFDRKREVLSINALHAKEGIGTRGTTGRAVRAAIERLAGFLGAREVEYSA